MSSDSLALCENALSLAATYWLHSTLLIGSVWLWLTFRPTASHLLQERIWKCAAIAGLATIALQASTGVESDPVPITAVHALNVLPITTTHTESLSAENSFSCGEQ